MLLPYPTKTLNNNLHFNKSKGFQRASPVLPPLLFCSSFICTFADVEVHPGYGATMEPPRSHHGASMEPPRSHHGATTKLPPWFRPRSGNFQFNPKTIIIMANEEKKSSVWSNIFRLVEIIAAALAGFFGAGYVS